TTIECFGRIAVDESPGSAAPVAVRPDPKDMLRKAPGEYRLLDAAPILNIAFAQEIDEECDAEEGARAGAERGEERQGVEQRLIENAQPASPKPESFAAPQADGSDVEPGRDGAASPAISSRFEVRDVLVDPGGAPLAAWQFELIDPENRVAIVGVEGGEHPAFRDPPYYDPASLARGRLKVAAFDLGRELPRARTRVARLHLAVRGEGDPPLEVRLVVAGDPEGREIPASISVVKFAPVAPAANAVEDTRDE